MGGMKMSGMKMSGREDGKGSGRRLFPAGPLLAALLSLAVFCGAGAAAPVRDVASRFAEERPVAWGMDLPGILRRASVEDRVVALTFDACGGARRGGWPGPPRILLSGPATYSGAGSGPG